MSRHTWDDLAPEVRERVEQAEAAAKALDDAIGQLYRLGVVYEHDRARLEDARQAGHSVADRVAADVLRALRVGP